VKIGNRYFFLLLLIIFIATVLRFYRIGERYGIFSDMARDIIVGREAVKQWRFPVVGSFSSAGPFVFGPLFYWYISLCYFPDINNLILPWLGIALLSVLFVYLCFKIGKKYQDKNLGFIISLLAATSFAQVFRSNGLTQHSFVGLSAILCLYFFILYFKTKKSLNLFYLGLSAGLGVAMHYQALNLLFFGIAIFFYTNKKISYLIKNLFYYLTGLVIPNLPIIIWDAGQDWANTRNMLDYFLIGQYRIYVPNRWLTYAGQYWPSLWASVCGAYLIIAWIIIGLFLSFSLKLFLDHKKKSFLFFLLILIFSAQFILFRYHRGERFEGYTLYFHPLIIFFSGWTVYQLYKIKNALGFLFLSVIIIANLTLIFPHLKSAQNQIPVFQKITRDLNERYPDKKFSLWDYNFNSNAYSYGLSVWLDSLGKIDKAKGIPIAVCLNSCPSELEIINTDYIPAVIADLKNIDNNLLTSPTWHDVNPEAVFEDVGFWWQKNKLTSSFSLQKYLLERLNFLIKKDY
jgi:hypothetical protein